MSSKQNKANSQELSQKTTNLDFDNKYDIYVVQQGDSVTKVAYKFGMSIQELTKINEIWGDYIYPQQVLKVRKQGEIKSSSQGAEESSQKKGTQNQSHTNSHYQLEEEVKEKSGQKGANQTQIKSQSSTNVSQGSSLSGMIQKSQKQNDLYQNAQGEISNIDHIYKKVFEEFSNFSKNFENRAPKQKNELQDFLSMFDQIKQEPSNLEEKKEEEEIEVSDYLQVLQKGNGIKTEAFYCTKLGQVKGTLTIYEDYLQFDAVNCQENEYLGQENINKFCMTVDYNDVSECDVLKLVNEAAIMVENNFIKQAYKFDFFIQLDLHTVNGLTLKGNQEDGLRIQKQNKTPIANIFIRFSHRDLDGMILTNKNEKKIVKELNKRLKEKLKNVRFTIKSSTFIPYYDSIIDEEKKNNLAEVQMTEMCADKVKVYGLKQFFEQQKESKLNSQPLIQFVPKKSAKSDILNDYQISALIENFPSIIKYNDWELLFCLNRDGVSVGTFFERCKHFKVTLLVVQDTKGSIFGGLQFETWRVSNKFYGTGENFLFTFKNANKPTIYRWTGENYQMQWGNEKAIGLGGGGHGRFGIYICDDFIKGSSSKTSTFENEILSSTSDFVVANLEVWGFE